MHANAHDGRYAPSPTGTLHLGNLRTALAAWLAARSHGARFALRIDDLDPDRSRPEHEAAQLEDLRLLGIDWDGAPVRQSDRRERYDELVGELVADELAYPCFCSRAEVLAAASAPHGVGPEAPYPGTCARLAPTEAAARVAAGEAYCVRVRAEGATAGFDDELLGRVDAVVDDCIVRRRDGVPAYNLASPADESDLGVGQVVRGADLAPTTPRQVWIAERLGLRIPSFAHVPLVLDPEGTRLAKRQGDVGLAPLLARGLTIDDVRARLAASLGVTEADGPAPSQLVAAFDPAHIPAEPWRIDPDLAIGQDS